ncbi:MAG: M23 family metallopeptidase [Spirochaetaceae bacterium]|jgi:murein DD-endopeptidase MepM/ murein hydrolase activator NlpD|nr:M23 family metallopeptidase [Spirochaetaceae bacterium]
MNRRYILPFLYNLVLLIGLAVCIGAEETIHIVQRGETIYSIARSYKVDINDLMKFNSIDDPQKLQAGQRLAIPGTGSTIEYRVAKGDTLYSIARHHEITLQTLRNANNLSESYLLKEGDLLKIPFPNRGSPAVSSGSPGGGSGAVSQGQNGGSSSSRTISSPPANPAPAPKPVSSGSRTVASPKPADPSIRWPVSAKEVLYMTGKLYGVALLGEKSEAVRSLTQGIVVSAGPYRGFGRVAIVQVTGGYLYVYGGCESLSVKEGDKITAGAELGKLGIDAVSRKPQLFFLVYRSNTPIDPAKAPRA